MRRIKYLLPTLILSLGLSVSAATAPTGAINLENPLKPVEVAKTINNANYQIVSPIDMVNNPSKYLNRNVSITAKFDKFSTLGLDYKPAMKSSEDFITFLIQRPDVTDHNIPLSELKIFIKRTEAEKYIDLNAGDEIQVLGKVFSNALGDVWMTTDRFTVTKKIEKADKK